MMIRHVMEALRREQGLLFGQVRGNASGIRERFGHGGAVVEGPEKVRRDHLIERVEVALEQGAREALEQLIAFGGGGRYDVIHDPAIPG
jgi:alcohol dehydrogenase class IV